MKKPKIFMYIYSLHTGGGAENVLYKVATYLRSREFEIIVCGMIDEEPSFEKDFIAQGVIVERLSCQGKSIISIIKALVKVLRKHQPDIMVNWLYPCIVTGAIAGRLAKVPKLVSNLRGPDLKKHWSKVWVDRFLNRLYDRHIAVSSGVAEVFQAREMYQSAKMTILENGLKLDNVIPDRTTMRQLLGLSETDFYIGSVGRLYPEKNQIVMIKALPLIKQYIPNIKMILVGDGPSRAGLEALAKELSVSEHVIFAGWQREVFKYLAALDLFVLPSRYEGHSSAILQAWLAKLPVVGSKVLGIKDLVVDGKNGLLYAVNKPDELANIVINLYRRPEYAAQLAADGHATVHEKYSIETMLKNYEKFFLEI